MERYSGQHPMHGHPMDCCRRCVGEIRHKIYETCCREIVRVCGHCGCEHDHRYPVCPRCGGPGYFMHGGMGRD